jgi:hypothetical protein
MGGLRSPLLIRMYFGTNGQQQPGLPLVNYLAGLASARESIRLDYHILPATSTFQPIWHALRAAKGAMFPRPYGFSFREISRIAMRAQQDTPLVMGADIVDRWTEMHDQLEHPLLGFTSEAPDSLRYCIEL